jgi:hypothetical protein
MSNFSIDLSKNNVRKGWQPFSRFQHNQNISIDEYLKRYCGLKFESHEELARLCLELWVENDILKNTISDFQSAIQAVTDMKIVGGDND